LQDFRRAGNLPEEKSCNRRNRLPNRPVTVLRTIRHLVVPEMLARVAPH